MKHDMMFMIRTMREEFEYFKGQSQMQLTLCVSVMFGRSNMIPIVIYNIYLISMYMYREVMFDVFIK